MLALAIVTAWLVGAPESAVPRLRLELVVAPELADRCSGPRDLEARVAERLGTDPFGARPTEAELVLWVHVEREPSGLRATVDLVGSATGESSGARALSSAACAELFDTIAVSVAVRLDPLGALGAAPDAPAVTTTATATASTPPTTTVDAPPPGPAPDPWTLGAHAAPWVSLGATPELSLGLRAGATLDHGALRLGLEGRYDLPTEALVARHPPGGSALRWGAASRGIDDRGGPQRRRGRGLRSGEPCGAGARRLRDLARRPHRRRQRGPAHVPVGPRWAARHRSLRPLTCSIARAACSG